MSSAGMLEHDWFPEPLPPNVEIGDRSWCYSSFAWLHSRSRREPAVRIGHDSGIYFTTFFELGVAGQVEIGNFCTLVGAKIVTNGRVVIRDYAFLAHEVVLADSFAPVPPHKNDRVQPSRSEVVIEVGENCWIGARAILLAGARLGEGSVVGAAAVVDFPVPPYSVVVGNPGRIVGQGPRS